MLEKIVNLEKEVKGLRKEIKESSYTSIPHIQTTPSFNPSQIPILGPPQQDLITNYSNGLIGGQGSANFATTIDNSDYLG